jgi:hypothetical protein
MRHSRSRVSRCVAALLLLTTAASYESFAGEIDWSARSRVLADRLTTELKTELTAAMQQGGPAQAIDVCRQRAPEIAARLSSESGAEVGRTALRVRNQANRPDELEQAMLHKLAEKLRPDTTGAPPEALLEVRTAQGVERIYLRAIPMQPPCLVCHGKALSPALADAIRADYPDDQATGFDVGELRGAVTVRWPSGD